MHVQSCCFGSQTYCFFDVLVAVAVVVAKAPGYLSIYSMKRAHAWKVIVSNHRGRGSTVFSLTTLTNADLHRSAI